MTAVAALVLAAGRSSRMAPHNKLLLRDETGRPMVARVAAACAASRAATVIVVTGHQSDAVTRAAQSGAPASLFTHAPDYAAGLSASLRAGVRALPAWVEGAIFCLGDMPLVSTGLIDRMIAAFDPSSETAALVPLWQGQRGNPVLWSRSMFGALCTLSGDAGARTLLSLHHARVQAVEADGPGVLTDYDSPAMLPEGWRADGLGVA